MPFFDEFFRSRNLTTSDGRPLHAYRVTDAEQAQLGRILQLALGSSQPSDAAGRLFVLWAAERIYRGYAEGTLSWDLVLAGIGKTVSIPVRYELTERGLAFWSRPLRRRPSDGSKMYLYSLLAEGGLPDGMLTRDSGYQGAVLSLVAELERNIVRDRTTAMLVAQRTARHLPQAFQTDDTLMLLADLGLAIAELRQGLPSGLEGEALESWLDRERPDWASVLPLRLSGAARSAILRPALQMAPGQPPVGGLPLLRLLRPRADGRGWIGTVRALPRSFVPGALMPFAQAGQILRLSSEEGLLLRASPEAEGWRLDPIGAADVALGLTEACIFGVNLDGRVIGEVVLDPGHIEPEAAPSFWAAQGEALQQLSRPRSRAEAIWLLAGAAFQPEVAEGLAVLGHEEGPGGRLWKLSGQGRLRIGGQAFDVATGAEEDAEIVQLVTLGQVFPHWQSRRGIPVYQGNLRHLAALPGGRLTDVGRQVEQAQMRNLLGGKVISWVRQGEVLARAQHILLPVGLKVVATETRAGAIQAEVTGLPPRWSVGLCAAGIEALGQREGDRHVVRLDIGSRSAGEVEMSLYDPVEGRRLDLVRTWPARDPILISPAGERLAEDRLLALRSIAGWRGVLPDRGGAIQMRIAGIGRPVAFPASGPLRLSSVAGVLGQALAMAGADGQVNLRLVAGAESKRLSIGRYDVDRTHAPDDPPGATRTVTALSTWPPHELRVLEADGGIDMQAWLGDSAAVWFVQSHAAATVHRAFVWSRDRQPPSTREMRVGLYVSQMERLLQDPADQGWGNFVALIEAARRGGDCGALDQVQALAQVPAFSLALLLRHPDPAPILDLETEAPIWWPLIRVSDWKRAILHFRDWQGQALEAAGFSQAEAQALMLQSLRRRLGKIFTLRRELRGHIAQALARVGLPPCVTAENGEQIELQAPSPRALLHHYAGQMVARDPQIPQGSGTLSPLKLSAPTGYNHHIRPVLEAPIVVAEIAAGLRPKPPPEQVLELLALRFVDPDWFDEALSLALQTAFEPTGNTK